MKYLPMLAKNGKISVLESDDYIFEPKLDGTRCVLVKRGRRVYMFNRLGQDFSYLYPLIKRTFEEHDDNFILDGEIICYNERGLPDHRLLMRRDQARGKSDIDMKAHAIPATLVAFDIIVYNGKELMSKKLEERKKILKKIIKENRHVERVMFTEEGNKLWELIKKSDMEGVMAKKKSSYYLPGERSNNWLKIKNNKSVDAIIMGYTPEKGGKTFDSLVIGLYKKKELIKVGTVKTGWDAESKKYIMKKLTPLKTKKKGKVQHIKPKEVCEVDYLELTKEKELRSPVYKRLRHKPIKKCTWKQLT